MIHGGRPLHGEIEISGAKNAAVAIIPAALMVDGVCRIENMPQISDVDMLLKILQGLGARVEYLSPSAVEIDCTQVRFVKKPSGAKPGRVIYTDYRTIITAADEALAERLRKD